MAEWKVIAAVTISVALTALVMAVAFTAYANSQRTASPYGFYGAGNSFGANTPGNLGAQNYPANGYQNPYFTQPVPPTSPTGPTYPQNIYPPYSGYPQGIYPATPYTPAYPPYVPWGGIGGSEGGYYRGYGTWGGHE